MIVIDDKILKQTPLAEGGEGIIYPYNDKILKVYKDNIDKNKKLIKLKKLMSKSLTNNIVAPLELAYNNRKQFIGFTMNKVDGEEFKRLNNKKFIKSNNIAIKDILKMLIGVKDTLKNLHSQNIYISDLNDCNILFDKNKNVYFIDVDSWTIDDEKCDVCMDLFKDPLLKLNEFSSKTDNYAFSILVFKALTRLHPFGGTMNPDIDIITRMKKKISVIDNIKVTIPRTITKWTFISPKMIKEMKNIFEKDSRTLIDDSLDDFYKNLRHCKIHNIDYYSKFKECPLCNENAQMQTVPTKIQSSNKGIPYIILFQNNNVNMVLSKDIYLDSNGYINHIKSKKKIKYNYGEKYYFSEDGRIIYTLEDNNIKINVGGKEFIFTKNYKSDVIVNNDEVYYIEKNNVLTYLKIDSRGNYIQNMAKVSFNNIFDICDKDNYFVCNMYQNMKILNIGGYNYTLNSSESISNYGLHFDNKLKQWLFIIENNKGQFNTYIFKKNELIYEADNIRYSRDLNNLCFDNNIIFKPGNKSIIGFNHSKDVYKNFNCDIINEDSKLIRKENKFIVINEKAIYEVG